MVENNCGKTEYNLYDEKTNYDSYLELLELAIENH